MSFKEKPQVTNGWINGGFFVAKTSFLKLISKDSDILERAPLEKASKKELLAYKHKGFFGSVWMLKEIEMNYKKFTNKISLIGKEKIEKIF